LRCWATSHETGHESHPAAAAGNRGEEPKPDLPPYTEEQRLYHSALLIEAGLAHGEVILDGAQEQ